MNVAGVYALTWRNRVVYVGQTKCLAERLYRHRSNMNSSRKRYPWEPRSNKMTFDGAHIRPCMIEDLDRLEREMIARYHPRYNIHHKPPQHATLLAPVDVAFGDMTFQLNAAPAVRGLVRRA